MYYDDHPPPHFHARYGELSAQISIKDFSIIEGDLPSRVLGLVVEWASLHQNELEENWELVSVLQEPKPIEPLQSFVNY